MHAVHRQHNTAADAAAREACRRAASAAAAGQRVPSCQKGRGLQLRAWLIVGGASARLLGFKVCVCGPRSRPSAGRLPWHWRWCGDCGLVGCPEWAARPTTVVSSGVLVGLGACALQPHGLSGSRVGGASEGGCGGGGWGAGVWWAGSRAQARGQLATVRHAHRVRHAAQADTASFRAVLCVGGKEAISRSDTALSRWRLQATCATRCK